MTSSTKLPRPRRPDLTRIPSVENGPFAPLTIENHPQTANIWKRNGNQCNPQGIHCRYQRDSIGSILWTCPNLDYPSGWYCPFLIQDEIRKEDERKNKQQDGDADDERKPKRIDQAPSEHAGEDLEGIQEWKWLLEKDIFLHRQGQG